MSLAMLSGSGEGAVSGNSTWIPESAPMANAVRSVSAALGGPTVKTLIDLTASFSLSLSRTASSTAIDDFDKLAKSWQELSYRPISSKGFYERVRRKARTATNVSYHGMFDAEVNAFLVWVDPDLNRIVDAPNVCQRRE